ncbi:hypothetical protein SXCC_02496 [Gluconacetobacter sp. SXCC-1]|nr:hypothetical protein SXCC_02496 [Gluconacetobacter sp. SXCC-1]
MKSASGRHRAPIKEFLVALFSRSPGPRPLDRGTAPPPYPSGPARHSPLPSLTAPA